MITVCVNSDFSRGVNEIVKLLRCYVAWVGI